MARPVIPALGHSGSTPSTASSMAKRPGHNQTLHWTGPAKRSLSFERGSAPGRPLNADPLSGIGDALAHEDLNELLNASLPFAQEMLAKHGEFFPFGRSMDVGGGIAHVAGWTGEEQPPSQEVI